MVAEAIPEVGQEPPNDVALATPESTPEAAPAIEANDEAPAEEVSVIDAILESLDSDADTGADNGKGATTDGVVPPTEKALTPEEAKEQGRREAESEIANRQKAAQDQAYVEGVRRSFQSVDSDLDAMADEWGLQADQRQRLKGRFQAHNGHWGVLHKAALDDATPQLKGSAYQEAAKATGDAIYEAIKEDLGEPALKSIFDSKPEKWQDLARAIVKESRKGLITREQAKAENTANNLKAQKAINEALASRAAQGIVTRDLKEIQGATSTELKPATGGSGSQPKDYAEAEAWHANGKWDNDQMRAYKATHSRT